MLMAGTEQGLRNFNGPMDVQIAVRSSKNSEVAIDPETIIVGSVGNIVERINSAVFEAVINIKYDSKYLKPKKKKKKTNNTQKSKKFSGEFKKENE